MKKLIIILTVMLPMSCMARFGWSFTDYSLLAGQLYRIEERPIWSIDFQYDRYRSSCLSHKKYFGFGAIYSFSDTYKELGLKGMWNPTRFNIVVNRNTKFYPYLFGQGNYPLSESLNSVSTEGAYANGFSIRPGLGLIGNIGDSRMLSVRTYFQAGYNIPFNNTHDLTSSLTFECKVGVGINSRKLKKNKQSKEKDKQTEAR